MTGILLLNTSRQTKNPNIVYLLMFFGAQDQLLDSLEGVVVTMTENLTPFSYEYDMYNLNTNLEDDLLSRCVI